ncbi:MAG: ATP-dependent DNA ligase 3'-phosphoesterase domain [Candidatus Methanohalarchaeum thermophilum]|uniref:ATP-dependent DNA ligase 3'-phosphoesterase domain n=1 Tax=Methanohalarchaeum thermophilum TaxID=1903181 RepID=A0A1Q6DTR0_METT1|nr:MAG: ATP-dependent DNA ligase 3'-phosphoesterase domain [Candidatus Methanohalarchaeum thermophilum]
MGNRFVIQKHDATTLHYDLRLEIEGVLKSWAVPKGLPEKKGEKNLAIQTEDHDLSYINFEGEIPEDEYGAGKVEIWDKGQYELKKKTDKEIKFKLNGDKVNSNFVLVKFKKENGKNQFLLIKIE